MYLSATAIAALPKSQKVHFPNPKAVRSTISLCDAVGLEHLRVHLITVAPGSFSTEFHAHLFEEECIYILSGAGVAQIGDAYQPLGADDFIGCPTNGIPHPLQATGTEPLIALVMGQRLSHDITDYPNHRQRLYRHNGQWDLVSHSNIRHPSGSPHA
jgi:uncharacterized cupin superfamily protein